MISCAARDTAPSCAMAWDASPTVYMVTMLLVDRAMPAESTGIASVRPGGRKRSFGTSFLVFSRAERSKKQDKVVEIEDEAAAPVTPQPNLKTNRQSKQQFKALATTVAYSIFFVFLSPLSAPMQTSCSRVACTEKMRASRYFMELETTSLELVNTFCKNHSAPTYLSTNRTVPIDAASHSPVHIVLLTASSSPLAFAPLTRGVIAVARN
mmetsp:Transcript_14113/g.39954  ORF Transcript_14113/g.39954 Transcript_14113/m.39954 type:complete len:210 (-) Transcript_14113:706-1335(-)